MTRRALLSETMLATPGAEPRALLRRVMTAPTASMSGADGPGVTLATIEAVQRALTEAHRSAFRDWRSGWLGGEAGRFKLFGDRVIFRPEAAR